MHVVLCSQTAFFCLHLGGEKRSRPVSIGHSFLTPPTAMGVVMNSNTFRLPLGSINRCLWSCMLADSNIGPQTFNLWDWRSLKGVGIH